MKVQRIFAILIVALLPAFAYADNFCGELKNAFGPFDYRKSEFAANLRLVDGAHFTSDVEQGIKGNSSYLGGDLDYTLRAFPNHHRALVTMAQLGLKDKTVQVSQAKYPVECYFNRAIRFTPDDGVVHAEYGNYLYALGQTDKALIEFKQAIALEPENPTINYNLGLALMKVKDYDNALIYAKKAYSLGFPLPGLKNKLVEAGKWNDKPGMIRSVVSKAFAATLFLGLIAAVSVYPVNKIFLTCLLAAYAALLFYRPLLWLFIVPALLPVLDFAPWTGWFFLDEFDLFLLTTAAVAYWRLGGERAKAKLPPFLAFSFWLAVCIAAIAMLIGLLPFTPITTNSFSNYFSHYNSLRVAKGFAWSIVLLPLLTKSAGDNFINIQRYLIPGMLVGFVGASLAVVWERLVFPGLTNFSSDYRPTASFSAMHTGGAALDAYLAMTFPLVAIWLVDSKSRIVLACALLILMLGFYVGFTTFSRDVYMAYAASAAIIIGLAAVPRLRRGHLNIGLLLGAALTIVVLAYLLTQVFATSGYRGLAASLCLLVAAVFVGAPRMRIKHAIPAALGAAALLAINFGAFVLLRNAPLPALLKPPYSVFLLSAGIATLGGMLMLSRQTSLHSRGLPIMAAAFPGLALAAALIAYHWGGRSAIIDIAQLIAAVLVIAAVLRFAPKPVLHLDRNTLGFTFFAAIVFATAIPVSSSYYLGTRFSTVQDDFSTRLRHWREAVEMMKPDWQTSLFGMGLGRYPDTYFWSNMHDETPGTYSYEEDENRAFLRLRAPQYAIGYGEVIRFLQHVDLTPNSAYRLSFDIRRMTPNIEFGLSVCERWMLYPQNCVNAPAKLMPADGNWHHYDMAWNSGPLGTRNSLLPTPVQLEISSYGANAYLDVSNISLVDAATGAELIRNGSFSHGNDFWFFSSDRNHFPWHIKNFFVNELFETGWLGLITISLLICYVAVNLLARALRGEFQAGVYLASLAGCMIVGLFDSIFDVPRLTLLFFLLIFVSTLRAIPSQAHNSKSARTSFKSREV